MLRRFFLFFLSALFVVFTAEFSGLVEGRDRGSGSKDDGSTRGDLEGSNQSRLAKIPRTEGAMQDSATIAKLCWH